MNVKFLILKRKVGKKIKRYQYTAIDEATRVRALKVYTRHTQKNAIAFVGHIVAKFPFRMQQIRTDRGHEFQAQFHWHVEDLDISKRGNLNLTARSSALTAQRKANMTDARVSRRRASTTSSNSATLWASMIQLFRAVLC